MTSSVNPYQYLQQAEIIYDELAVSQAISSIAIQLNQYYVEEMPIVLSVMNGAAYFAGQLLPQLIALGFFGRQQLFFGNDELIEKVQCYLPSGWNLASNPIPSSINRVLINVSRETRLYD